MSPIKKAWKIILNAVPIVVMVALIPRVKDDFFLTIIYVAIIGAALWWKRERHDFLALVFGFIAITISEYFFIKTGVETFVRHSLFGLMPFWLPFLWAYGFVAIKRSLRILDHY